jgi:hypothetical protein
LPNGSNATPPDHHPKFNSNILNRFLIEDVATDRHAPAAPNTAAGPKASPGNAYGMGKRTAPGDGSPRELFGGQMILFSRAFVRKRVISLAATTSVAITSLALAQGSTPAERIRDAIPRQHVSDRPDYDNESPFLSENDAAMNKMMADMTIKPTGDIDRDFVAMMVPHHRGAVDMAKAELRYGHDARLRRLAQKIVENQQKEITLMRAAVDDERPAPADASNLPPTLHDTVAISHGDTPRN